jgi:hypothetical protein
MSVRRFVQVTVVALLVALAWALPARVEPVRVAVHAPDATRSLHRLLDSLANEAPVVEAVRASVLASATDVGSNRSSSLPLLLVLFGIAVVSLGRSRRSFLALDAGRPAVSRLVGTRMLRGPPRRGVDAFGRGAELR